VFAPAAHDDDAPASELGADLIGVAIFREPLARPCVCLAGALGLTLPLTT